MGVRPTSPFDVATTASRKVGSPGPGEMRTPSGSSARISSALVEAGTAGDATAHPAEDAHDVVLDAEIEEDDVGDGLAVQAEVAGGPVVGALRRHLVDEGLIVIGAGGAQAGEGVVGASLGGDGAHEDAVPADAAGEGAGIDAGDGGDAGVGEVVVQGHAAVGVAGLPAGLPHDEAAHLDALRFDIEIGDAVSCR